MRVSIVTTTYNAMPFVAETIRSVLQSSYADLEYLIVDAGSQDGTLEFLQKIDDPRVSVDILRGAPQYVALDWGLRRASGEIAAWLNGDDMYMPWTISCVARLFREFSDLQWLTGLPVFANTEGDCTFFANLSSYPRRYIRNGWFSERAFGNLVQESMFWRRSLYENAGGLDLRFEHAADFELWTRFAKHAALEALDIPLAAWRRHDRNRSRVGASSYLAEVDKISSDLPKLDSLRRWLCARRTTKHALRLAEWHRTPWIYFSWKDSSWKRTVTFRPISRYRIPYLQRQMNAL